MSRRKEARVVVFAFIGLLLAVGSAAWGKGMAFNFNVATLKANYTASPGADGVVGTISITDDDINLSSRLALAQLDLGDDGAVGGGGANADLELDLAEIDFCNSFDMQFSGTVIKLGTNSYQIVGPLRITDTTNDINNAEFQAWFTSNYVSINNGWLSFTGDLSVLGGNDSLLLPGPGETWVYNGIASNTPASPDLDGVRGRVSLDDLRTSFDHGIYAGGGFFGNFTGNMDAWFAANRTSEMVDVQAEILPEPAGLLLLLLGLALWNRKIS